MSRMKIILLWVSLLAGCHAADYGVSDYDITPLGPRNIYAGYDGLLPFRFTYLNGGLTRYLYFDSISGVPEGVTAKIFCGLDNRCRGTGLPYVYPYSWGTAAIHVTAAANAEPGDYTLTLATHDYEGHAHTTEVPLRILPAPEAPAGPASYQPPMPTLAQWKQVMTSQGATFCNESNKAQKFAFGYEGSVWYYDGARVFYQMQDATQEGIWRECAENVATQYADYVNGACSGSLCGKVPGWRVFPRGLRMAYERTGEEKYRTAVENLAANGFFSGRPGGLTDDLIRESAYALEAFIEAKHINSPNYESVYLPKARIVVNELLAMYEQIFDWHTFAIHQVFFDGLAAEALITYYTEVTPDPRIPVAIKKMLDWTWSAGWDHKRKLLAYRPDAVPWSSANGLIGLIVPAFAWYYNISGDVTYLQRGDELFAHMFDEPFYSGKQFSQTFRWSFDYVAWRKPNTDTVGITVPEHVYPGGEQEITVTLPGAATGKCGEAVRFPNAAGTPGWPNTVSVPRGSTSKTVRIRPSAGGKPKKTTITASYRSLCGQPAISGTAVTLAGGDHLDVVLTTTRVPGGIFPNNRIELDGPAPEADTMIDLTTDRPDLVRFLDLDGRAVTSIRIAKAAAVSDYFYVDTGAVATAITVMVTASLGDLGGSAEFVIDPPAPRLATQGTLLAGGFSTTLNQVVLDKPAPAEGMPVSVWTDNKGVVSEPVMVTVPEGQISAFFSLKPILNPAGATVAWASYGTGKSFAYQIDSSARTLVFRNVPATIQSGRRANITVKFLAPGGADGWIPEATDIVLQASDPDIAIPAAVKVPAYSGVTQASFEIQAGNVNAAKDVTITASSPTGHRASITITVKP